jgi:hypothetical protein
VSMLVEDMSRNKCFSQVIISHVLRVISICDLFSHSSSHSVCKTQSYRFRNNAADRMLCIRFRTFVLVIS